MNLRHFSLAKKLSMKSDYCHKIGAVIVNKRGKPEGVGFNNPKKTHPLSGNPFKTLHAELSAILNAGEDCFGCDIYIYRQLKSGQPANAKPCKFCLEMIRKVGIVNIYYTDEGDFKQL